MALTNRDIKKEIKELAEINLPEDFKSIEENIKKREREIIYTMNHRTHDITLDELAKMINSHNSEIDRLMAGE